MQFFMVRESLVWLLLIAATASTWFISSNTSSGVDFTNGSRFMVVLIAAIKIRLILREFMHVKGMPFVWKAVFDAWLLAVSMLLYTGFVII